MSAMQMENAYALVVGICRYQHVSTLPRNRDADDIAAVLRDPLAGGYPAAAVCVLTDEEATRDAILAALDRIARDAPPDATVWIYYSGHGAVGEGVDPQYYLVPVDVTGRSEAELAASAISDRELTQRIAAIPAARVTVVLDCCHASALTDVALVRAVSPMAQGRGRAVIAASRAEETAQQESTMRNSAMTGHLLAGMRGAAATGGQAIGVCDLFEYVQRAIATAGTPQHPVFLAEIEESYPVVRVAAPAFALPAAPDDATYDAFLSYCEADADDRAWVTGFAAPYLERLGLQLCLAERDFRLGALWIDELEAAIEHSRYTVAIVSPAYLESAAEAYESVLAAHDALSGGRGTFIPVIRRPCKVPLRMHALARLVDASRDHEVGAALEELAKLLRRPPGRTTSSHSVI